MEGTVLTTVMVYTVIQRYDNLDLQSWYVQLYVNVQLY